MSKTIETDTFFDDNNASDEVQNYGAPTQVYVPYYPMKWFNFIENITEDGQIIVKISNDFVTILNRDGAQLLDCYYSIIRLHGCGSYYVAGNSNGNEYILFLRKKSDPDVPYFTVNITPEEHIRQIHGKCNCNVPKELRPFIKQWAHKFNINISHISSQLCHL